MSVLARVDLPRLKVVVAVTLASVVVLTPTAVAQDEDPDVAPLRTTSEAALALEDAIPDVIAGLALETLSYDGVDIIEGADADDPVAELQEMAAAAGVGVDELLLASGTAQSEERFVGVLAARLGGVDAAEFAPALTPLLLETTDATPFVRLTIGDLDVTQVGPGTGLTGEALVYVAEIGDTAWYVVTDAELLEEVLETLPRPGGAPPSGAASVSEVAVDDL